MIEKPKIPCLERLDSLLYEMNETSTKLKLLKKELSHLPEYFAKQDLTYDESIELAKYLYWEQSGISVALIAEEMLGLSVKEFKNLIEHVSSENLLCTRCNKPIIFKSKNAIQDYNRGFTVCKECIDLQQEESHIQYEQDKLRREQELKQLKTMPYKDYLQTDHWIKTRDYHLRRSNYKCQICNKGGKLNVHHRTYENRGEERTPDLITLCEDCHVLFHNQGKIVNH